MTNAVDAGRKKKGWLATLLLLMALGLFLAPAPREWGAFGRWISPHYDRVQPVVQPVAHVVFMAVFSGLLMRHFTHRSIRSAILYSLVLAGALAVMLEILQSTLPSHFARKCDADDLVPAFIGVLMGCMIGGFLRWRDERDSSSNLNSTP